MDVSTHPPARQWEGCWTTDGMSTIVSHDCLKLHFLFGHVHSLNPFFNINIIISIALLIHLNQLIPFSHTSYSFPELFEYISKHSNEDTYYEVDVFGEDTQRLKDLQDWVKGLECSKAPKVQIGHKSLSEKAVKLMEEDLDAMQVRFEDSQTISYALCAQRSN